MRIGVLKEIKTKEHRVAVTPEGVEQMLEHGHEVFVEIDAGNGSDFYNEDYVKLKIMNIMLPKDFAEKVLGRDIQ